MRSKPKSCTYWTNQNSALPHDSALPHKPRYKNLWFPPYLEQHPPVQMASKNQTKASEASTRGQKSTITSKVKDDKPTICMKKLQGGKSTQEPTSDKTTKGLQGGKSVVPTQGPKCDKFTKKPKDDKST